MKIKKVLIGNNKEAFIEGNFTDGINIISSDENNKGKTIVIQSLLYALGNEPIFPSSFEYNNYYHIAIILDNNGNEFSICRKKDSFIVSHKKNISIYESVAEFKRYINKNIFEIPIIIKNGIKKLVDPALLYQLFFVAQDKKNTSSIFSSGYYTKEDFINMIYAIYGIGDVIAESGSQKKIQKQIDDLKIEKKLLEKKNKILKSDKSVYNLVNSSNDRNKLNKQIQSLQSINNKLIDLNRMRNRALIRKSKNEEVLKELRSLNNTLKTGTLHCLDCQSPHVGYSTGDNACTFDISSIEIRNQIISSIEDKINAYSEEIEGITHEININQEELKELLLVQEVDLESILLFKDELLSVSEIDLKITQINTKLDELKNKINESTLLQESNNSNKTALIREIVYEMNKTYRLIDPHGNLIFDNLFSKRNYVFSGSEGIEFYISRLCALCTVLKHKFPIIIDCFRDGELSSEKEETVLRLFSNYENQIILTATLKKEELNKYVNREGINNIDYTSHEPCKLLCTRYIDEFSEKLKEFLIYTK